MISVCLLDKRNGYIKFSVALGGEHSSIVVYTSLILNYFLIIIHILDL